MLASLALLGYGAYQWIGAQDDRDQVQALEHPSTFSGATKPKGKAVSRLGPDMLAAPEVDLSIPLTRLGLDAAGDFQVPDSAEASIYSDGAQLGPDQRKGSVFALGHVNFPDGSFAPMASIAKLTPGSRITTTDSDGDREEWMATSMKVVPRDGLTPDMWSLGGDRRLVLVTCAGEINASVGVVTEFTENLVVIAEPVPDDATP
ncbi:class F sortase [Leucobacter zeae]|nr:class F sortase [Leucobacter zeae]